ncbi:MAG TPA: tetratricopeptide repeat protein [Candidatus Binataceae bacterium]|nr:tetratricopeptide repeat protein [Candidatus Binataceae bacterium]
MPAASYRTKIRRKDLKQPDEFLTLIGRAREFILANRREALVAAGTILVLGVLATSLYYMNQNRDRAAGELFTSAIGLLNSNNPKAYQIAETQFKQLADTESSRRVGQLARFYMASAYLAVSDSEKAEDPKRANDLAQARDALTAFIAADHDPMFLGMAQTNLGLVYERMGDWAKAADAYTQAASTDGPEQLRAELSVARMLEKKGDKAGAISAYKAFLKAHPLAPQRQEAMESLALLGVAVEKPLPATINADLLKQLKH